MTEEEKPDEGREPFEEDESEPDPVPDVKTDEPEE